MTSSIDPIPLFLMAEQYRRASHYLVESEHRGYIKDVTMPAAVCAAFALELYFKTLVALDSGQTARIHDLRALFDKLAACRQQRIRDLFQPHLPKAQRYFDTSREASSSARTLDFDRVLEMSRNAFPDLRYVHEGWPAMSGWLAADILEATREAILEINPAWAHIAVELPVHVERHPLEPIASRPTSMTDDEIAFRAALNILRDSIESGRMPSGQTLASDVKALHQRAADQFDKLVSVQANATANEVAVRLSKEQALALVRLIDRHGGRWDETEAAGVLWRALEAAGYEPC